MDQIKKQLFELMRPTQELLLEIDESDPRFADNKDVKMKEAKLGEVGKVIDLILHPNIESSIEEAYAKFLGCDVKNIQSAKKTYPCFKANIVKFSIDKDDEYDKQKMVFSKKNNDGKMFDVEFGSQSKDFDIVHAGPDKEIKVPTSFHVGLVSGEMRIIILTFQDWNCFGIKFYYEKGKEEWLDQYIDHLDELVAKNNFYKCQKITPKLEFLKIPKMSWSDIVLDEEIKNKIVYNVVDFFEKEKIYKKNGISSKCGLIWEGQPGTGKTLAAKILTNILSKITFVWVTPDDLNSSFDVKNIYDIARDLNPAIVFFEDADLFCGDRSLGGNNSILGEIMNQLDGFVPLEGVVTIFTSNDPSIMEKALIDRPGRFDERIVFSPPNKEAIVKMSEKFLDIPKFKKEDLAAIAERAEEIKLTGAHVRRLCDLATITAIKDDSIDGDDIAQIKEEHFKKAFDNIRNMKIKAGEKAEYLQKNTVPAPPIELKKEEVVIEVKKEARRSSFMRDVLGKI